MSDCVLVNPSIDDAEKARYGIDPDPLVANVVPGGLRRVARRISTATLAGVCLLGASLPADIDSIPAVLALPLSAVVLAGAFAPALVAGSIRRARLRAFRRIDGPHHLLQILEQIRVDAVRFRDIAAAQSQTRAMAESTAQSLSWLLWHTAERIERIGEFQRNVKVAGARSTGPAKEAWLRDQRSQIDELEAPVVIAAAHVRALADMAEDTVWAARLATERHPTVAIAAPTPHEIGASEDIEAAIQALASLRSAWTELDERLRVLAEQHPTTDPYPDRPPL